MCNYGADAMAILAGWENAELTSLLAQLPIALVDQAGA
jgi:hypothetical protein